MQVLGNEFADMQAKQGTMNNENRVFLPPPLSWARHIESSQAQMRYGQKDLKNLLG